MVKPEERLDLNLHNGETKLSLKKVENSIALKITCGKIQGCKESIEILIPDKAASNIAEYINMWEIFGANGTPFEHVVPSADGTDEEAKR